MCPALGFRQWVSLAGIFLPGLIFLMLSKLSSLTRLIFPWGWIASACDQLLFDGGGGPPPTPPGTFMFPGGWLHLEFSQVLLFVDYFALDFWNIHLCIIFSSSTLSGRDGVAEYLVAKEVWCRDDIPYLISWHPIRLNRFLPYYFEGNFWALHNPLLGSSFTPLVGIFSGWRCSASVGLRGTGNSLDLHRYMNFLAQGYINYFVRSFLGFYSCSGMDVACAVRLQSFDWLRKGGNPNEDYSEGMDEGYSD